MKDAALINRTVMAGEVTMPREHKDEDVSRGSGSEREERGGVGSPVVRITTWNGTSPECLSFGRYLLCCLCCLFRFVHPSYICFVCVNGWVRRYFDCGTVG